MAFTPVTLTRDYDLADGLDPGGWVQATPTAPMVNAGVTVVAVPVRRSLNIDGILSLPVVANTDPATTPVDTSYLIEESINNVQRSYYVIVPHTGGSSIDLSTLATAAIPPVVTYPVPGPAGPAGPVADTQVHAVGNSGTALTLDAASASGYIKTITMTGNCTFTFTGATAGLAATLELILTQDATGSRTATWPASVRWAGGAPLLTTTASGIDRVVFTSYNGGTIWFGDLIGKGYA